MAAIGFIGLGNMGGPMARNLLKAGHRVKAFDLAPAALAAAAKAGAETARSVAEAADGVDAVISMLPAGQHVRHVYAGPDGVLAAAAPGTLLIDCSTIDVDSARAVAAAAAARGMAMVDAPVSGGVAGAAAASPFKVKGGYHNHTGGPHNHPHFQINWWTKGVKGSGGVWRIPLDWMS